MTPSESDQTLVGINDLQNVPQELRERPQWVMWRMETREKDKKPTKVPYRPLTQELRKAAANRPNEWGTFDDVRTSLDTRRFSGAGFMFRTEDPYTAVDLDNCIDHETGELYAWAHDIVTKLNSYTELSPSQTGLHIIVRAVLPDGKGRKSGAIEMYNGDRYFTMTGNVYGEVRSIEDRQDAIDAVYTQHFDAPKGEPAGKPISTPKYEDLDDNALWERMFASKKSGADIRALYNGEYSGWARNGKDGRSEADLALASHLMWWTGNDMSRADRMFRGSGLNREKWVEKRTKTYGQRTLEKAIATQPRANDQYEQKASRATPTQRVLPSENEDSLPELDEPTSKTRLVYLGRDETLMRQAKRAAGEQAKHTAFVADPDPAEAYEALRRANPDLKAVFVGPTATDSQTHRAGLLHNAPVTYMVDSRLAPALEAAPNLAFTDVDPEATFKRKVALAEKYGFDILIHKTGGELPELGPGVHVQAQGMGGFKSLTAAAEAKRQEAAGKSALTLTQYRSLAGPLALINNATHYSTITPETVEKERNAVYVINSIPRRVRHGRLIPADFVHVDEADQVARRYTSNKDFPDKVSSWEGYIDYNRAAETLIHSDAHPTEASLNLLRTLRPNEPITMHLSRTRSGLGRCIQPYLKRGGVRRNLKAALEHGENGWLAVDSVRQARRLRTYFRKHFPDLPILLVCSDTSSEPEVERFFADPNTVSAEYRLVIASPTVSTGVSIENGHFTWVGGEFGAQVRTPTDAWQALSRVRGAPLLHVWVERKRRRAPNDRTALKIKFFDEIGDNLTMCGITNGRAAIRCPIFEALMADTERINVDANNRYSFLFWELAAEEGWEILPEAREAPAEAVQMVKEADTLEQAEYEARLLDTRDVSGDEIAKIKKETETRSATLEEQDLIERYSIRTAHALPERPDRETMEAAIKKDERGAWRHIQNRLGLVVRGPREAKEVAHRNLEQAGGRDFLITYRDVPLEAELYEQFLALQFNTTHLEVKGEGFIDPDGDEMAEFIGNLAAKHVLLSEFAGVPSDLGVKPGIIFRSMSRALGIKQKRCQRQGVTGYVPILEAFEERREVFVRQGLLRPRGPHNPLRPEPPQNTPPGPRNQAAEPIHVGETPGVAHNSVNKEQTRYVRPPVSEMTATSERDKALFEQGCAPHDVETLLGEMTPEADPTAYVAALLAEGKLDGFGPSKLALITRKVAECDGVWLGQLARSRDFGQGLEARRQPPPSSPIPAPQAAG